MYFKNNKDEVYAKRSVDMGDVRIEITISYPDKLS